MPHAWFTDFSNRRKTWTGLFQNAWCILDVGNGIITSIVSRWDPPPFRENQNSEKANKQWSANGFSKRQDFHLSLMNLWLRQLKYWDSPLIIRYNQIFTELQCASLNRIKSGQGHLILLSGGFWRDHVPPQEPIKNPLNCVQIVLEWLSVITADRIPIDREITTWNVSEAVA
jgi:hypothetical protein